MARRRRHTQKSLKKLLKEHGWAEELGGKHVVKMTKKGQRPITIPMLHGETLPIGLTQAILKQADIDDDK